MIKTLFESIMHFEKLTQITDKKGMKWFVAEEINRHLYNKAKFADALDALHTDEKKCLVVKPRGKMSGDQGKKEVLLVNEYGLCNLILQDEEGYLIRRWLVHEVIPTLLDNHSYEIQDCKNESD